MQADYITVAIELLERNQLIAERRIGMHRPGDDAHADRSADLGEAATDGSEPDDPQRLAGQLGAVALRPAALADLGMRTRYAPGDGKQQRQTVLRNGYGRHAGRVG